MPSSPRRMSNSGPSVDAAEVAAVDVRDSVVLGQPLVDEGVVGVQQIDDAAVFVHDAVDEHLGFLAHGLAQVVVEIGKQRDGRSLALQAAQVQPLAGEVSDQFLRARIGEHALHLLFEHGRVVQLVLAGEQ